MRGMSARLVIVLGLLLGACGGGGSAPRAAPAPGGDVPAASGAAPTAAAAAAAPAPAAASQVPGSLTQVRGGMLPSILSAPLFAGVDLGIYQQNGLDVQVEPFTSTGDMLTLIAGGRLEFGQVTMGAAAFNAFNRGVDLVIGGSGPLALLSLLIRKDLYDSGAIRSARDLKGTRFALNGRGTIIEWMQAKVLEKGGLTPEDVEAPILPWPDQVTALGNRAIDVGFVGEPLGSLAVARGVAVILEEREPGQGEPWYAPNAQGSMILMNRTWAEANPAAATAVVKSYVQAARRMQGTRIFEDEPALASVEKWVNVKPDVVRQATPPLWALNGRLDVGTLTEVQRYFLDTGATDYQQPIPLDRMYNDTWLNDALREIGVVPES
jgi:NitT/TauT family transport system substrate-binding protein